MLAVSVQPTPLRWMTMSDPSGPAPLLAELSEGVMTSDVSANAVPRATAAMRGGPPRSSGTCQVDWNDPSAVVVTWNASLVDSSQPVPPTRFPMTVDQVIVTSTPLGRPRP